MTGVAYGLQNRFGAFARPGWVRFPHAPATCSPFARVSSRAGCAFIAAGVIGLWGMAAVSPVIAQELPPPDSVVTEPQPPDSTAVASPVVGDGPPIAPLAAFGRSMIIPGWGQLEVGRGSRGAVYFAAESIFLYMVFKADSRVRAAREQIPQNETRIENRTKQRENWIVLAGFTAFLSGIDAWISTQFWDWQPKIGPPPDGTPGVSLGVEVHLP